MRKIQHSMKQKQSKVQEQSPTEWIKELSRLLDIPLKKSGIRFVNKDGSEAIVLRKDH